MNGRSSNKLCITNSLANFQFWILLSPVQPKQFSEIIELLKTKTITHSTAQRLLSLLYHGDLRSPKQVSVQKKISDFCQFRLTLTKKISKIVTEEKLDMIKDPQILRNICLRIIEENPKLVSTNWSIICSYSVTTSSGVETNETLIWFVKVASYRLGKSKAFGGLRGLLKKNSDDRFDMGEATKLLKELLENQWKHGE